MILQTVVGERTRKIFWAMYNRKWYVVQKATDEETPNEIRNKRIKDTTVVKFMCDETYSAIPNTRIQPFGTTEIDEKRGKRDAKGYAIASTAKYGTDADKNNVQKENGKEDNESDETPDLVINDVCDKKEGETKTDDETTITSLNFTMKNARKYSFSGTCITNRQK